MFTYAKSFLGIPYRWWNPAVSCCDTTGPFWAGCNAEVLLAEVQRGHLNCAGFLNVLCLRAGIPIPDAAEGGFYAGGTVSWWRFFEGAGKLKPYVEGAAYPPGSILLRKYYHEEDQGHIAIVCGEGLIIHSWPEVGVAIEKPAEGYYEAVVRDFLPWESV